MDSKKKKKISYILLELVHHLPFSIFGITIGLVVMGVLTFFAVLFQVEHRLSEASQELFHVFHAAHILVSAVASTAMFWKHDNNLKKALIIGFFGSLTICGVSDVLIPYMGGLILGSPMHIHICLLEEPSLVIPFAVMGVLAGLTVTNAFEKSTEYSHAAHVFFSSMASILYLISFGLVEWIHVLGGVFMVIICAVMIPCCASDIAFPLACAHKHCHHKKTEFE